MVRVVPFGQILDSDGARIGVAMSMAPFRRRQLQGQLISIGGKDASKHLIIQDGPVRYSGLETTEEMARELRHQAFDHVRLNGTGRWLRLEDGTWKLLPSTSAAFEILSDEPLADVVAKLRKVPATAGQIAPIP